MKNFSSFEYPSNFLIKIKDGEIKLEEAKKYQKKFKSYLNAIVRGKFKWEEEEGALKNQNFLQSMNKSFRFFW